MERVYKILFALLFVNLLSVNAENPQKLFLSVDFGTKGLMTELNDSWPVRQDVGSTNSSTNRSLNINSEMNYLGLSAEYAFDKKWSLISGLRYIMLNGEAIKDDYSRGGSFFLRLNSAESHIEYARIMSISDKSSFLGVPIELKFTPFHFGFVSLYSKLSTEFAYRLFNNTDIEFKIPEMKANEASILEGLNLKSNPFYSSVYITLGAQFKLSKELYTSIDVLTPALYMTKNNSNLLNINNISGIQLSLIYLLNK